MDAAGDEESVIGNRDAAGTVGQKRAIGHTNAGESVPSHTDRAALKVEEPGTHTGGVTGRIDGVRYAVGSPEFAARTCGLDPAAFRIGASGPSVPSGNEGDDGTGETNDGATHVLLAREGALLARFVLADTLRPDASALVEGLRRRGIETTIASGAIPPWAAAIGMSLSSLAVAANALRLGRGPDTTGR